MNRSGRGKMPSTRVEETAGCPWTFNEAMLSRALLGRGGNLTDAYRASGLEIYSYNSYMGLFYNFFLQTEYEKKGGMGFAALNPVTQNGGKQRIEIRLLETILLCPLYEYPNTKYYETVVLRTLT